MSAADLFSYAEARERRDRGMALAEAAQNRKVPRWSDIAYAAIENVARRQVHVFVDDVLAAGVPEPAHFNSWGPVWKRAIDNGVLQRTNQTRVSADPKKHCHSYPIYFSQIYDPRCA